MLRTQISVLPAVLPVSDADLRVSGYCIIQIFISFITEKHFAGLRDKNHFIGCNLFIGCFRRCGHSYISDRRIIPVFIFVLDCRGSTLQIIIGKSDPVDIFVGDILFGNGFIFGVSVIAFIQAVHITHICIIDGVKVTDLHRFFDTRIIIFYRPVLHLACKGKRSIGPVSRKYISSRIVHISCGVILVPEHPHLLSDNGKLLHTEILIGSFVSLFYHVCEDLCSCSESLLCHSKPALRIGGILFIILCQLRYAGAKTQCTDGNNRIVRRSCNLLLGRHLCAQFILQNLIVVDVI